tara:strand:- start:3389 stop:4228 length:840 start_codon:yes stop_codon:yes gene_type:complete
MSEKKGLLNFLSDRLIYGNYNKSLTWFKKNKGRNWINGQNFGDYLSIVIVGEILKQNGLNFSNFSNSNKLLAVGSVIHFANNNDIVWGSGINGKISESRYKFNNLDIRAVRGPLTKEILNKRNISVPEIYGDPVLLLPSLFPLFKKSTIAKKIIVLPNLNELEIAKKNCPENMKIVSPLRYWKSVVNEILSSELVLTSSLHGLIISELFDVPARFLKPVGGETLFKYDDYYLGTNRVLEHPSDDFRQNIKETSGVPSTKLNFDPQNLLNSFPIDLFKNS